MKKIILTLILALSVFAFSEPIRKLSVTGNAEKEVMPDTAQINFRVYTKNENLKKAGQENSKNMENFKNELKKKNIPVSGIETYNYYTQKTSERDTAVSKKTEYYTTLYFALKVTDLTKIPDLISLSESNKIKSLKSDSTDKSIYYGEINRNNAEKTRAISDTFKVYDGIKSQLSRLGINGNDISVYSYSTVSKETSDNKPVKNKEYHSVYNDFVLDLKDISKINEVIKIAEANKINVQGSIAFDISNKDELESELYNKAYEQTKTKAESILKSSEMRLGEPLVVSESIAYQNLAVQQDYNYDKRVAKPVVPATAVYDYEMASGMAREITDVAPQIDYRPQVMKLTQNVSVLFEIK
jgi:uncharacterized protein YggE